MADLSEWNPFAGLQALRHALFGEDDDPLADSITPITDVYTRNDTIVIDVHLPGFTSKEVDLDVNGADLTISAYHREPRDEADKKYIVHESSASYQRRITLPDGADTEQIQASLVNGILTVTIPTPVVKASKMKIAIGANGIADNKPKSIESSIAKETVAKDAAQTVPITPSSNHGTVK